MKNKQTASSARAEQLGLPAVTPTRHGRRCLCTITAWMLLLCALSLTACSDGGGGNGPPGTRDPKTYTGTASDGVEYTLKIEDGGSRAVLTPAQGDKYTLTTADSKKSTGTVKKAVGGELTLAPKENPDEAFTATVSGNGMTAMSGTITWDDGTTKTAPTTFTGESNPGGGSSGLNGTWVSEEGEKVVLNNGSFTSYSDDVAVARGTYTTSGNSITVTLTQLHGSLFEEVAEMGLSPSQWYTKEELRTTMINYMVSVGQGYITREFAAGIVDGELSEAFAPLTGTYSLGGNTLTMTMVGADGTTVLTREGAGGNPVGDPRDPKTYTGTAASGVTYTLKIEDGGARAVLTPTQGDKYTLTQNATSQQSTGTVTKVVGAELTLAPREDPDDEFTATVSGNGITAMSGNITWDDGTATYAPSTLTQGGGNPNPGGTAPTITTTSLPGGTVGTAYSQTLTATGDAPITWSIDTGALPNGLTLSTTGLISGTPTTANTFSFTVKAANATGSNTKPLSIVIAPAANPGGWKWIAAANHPFSENDDRINGIAYGGGKWVAVGNNGKMAYSSDGITWIEVTDKSIWEWTSVAGNLYRYNIVDIAYGDGKFVAGGNEGIMAYSSDGITWIEVTDKTIWRNGTSYRSITSIAYGGGKWVAGCNDGVSSSAEVERMAYSDDGVSWTKVTDFNGYSGHCRINDIAYGGDKFVVVSSDYTIAYSNDGISWTITEVDFGTRSSTDNILSVAYDGGKFVAGGAWGRMAYSANGVSWTNVADSSFGSVASDHIGAMACGSGRFVAGAGSGKTAYSADGINWTAVADRTVWVYTYQNGATSTYTINSIAYGGGRFVAAGYFNGVPGKLAYADW